MNDFDEHELTVCLADYGIDYADAMDRFLHNDDLYKRCAQAFLEAPYLDRLEAAFYSKDLKEIEFASHTLKGSASSISLPMLYKAVSQICEFARSGDSDSAASLMPKAKETYGNAVRGLQQLL